MTCNHPYCEKQASEGVVTLWGIPLHLANGESLRLCEEHLGVFAR